MLAFPNAKINLGLRILRKREDGFHDIETLMYPVGFSDLLEIIPDTGNQPDKKISLKTTGIAIPRNGTNLVIQACQLLQEKFDIPSLSAHLHKMIPAGAGLGGGSSNGSSTLMMLNKLFQLGLTETELVSYSGRLGADCPFFILNKAVLASGKGDIIRRIHLDLTGYHLLIIVPEIEVNTAWAYSRITPSESGHRLEDLLQFPPEQWKDRLLNSFEEHVFNRYPEIRELKKQLYHAGAVYASMSGSGSAVFGIFNKKPVRVTSRGDFVSYLCAL